MSKRHYAVKTKNEGRVVFFVTPRFVQNYFFM